MIDNLIKWWVGYSLPEQHYRNKHKYFRTLFKTFLIHPIFRRIAKYYLIFLKKCTGIKVIAITGSAGKTTTKEMLASILKKSGTVVYSFKNIDPVYNIPATICKCRLSTKYLILEMGVEYPGEMDFYLWLVTPDIGVITNIYPTHTEFFNNTAGVYKEKSKLCLHLNKNSISVLNRENKYLRKLGSRIKSKIVYFGNGTNTMSFKEEIILEKGTRFLLVLNKNKKERIWITIPAFGKQFVYNALAASSVARCLGFTLKTIKRGLESYPIPEHRMKVIKHKSGAVIIDDTYNNNPQAAIEALETLSVYAGTKDKIVVFGDMLELGNLDRMYHIKLGESLGKYRLKHLFCVGISSVKTAGEASKMMGKSNVSYDKNWENLNGKLKLYLNKNTVILIKGSRSIGLDKLVSQIMFVKNDKI